MVVELQVAGRTAAMWASGTRQLPPAHGLRSIAVSNRRSPAEGVKQRISLVAGRATNTPATSAHKCQSCGDIGRALGASGCVTEATG